MQLYSSSLCCPRIPHLLCCCRRQSSSCQCVTGQLSTRPPPVTEATRHRAQRTLAHRCACWLGRSRLTAACGPGLRVDNASSIKSTKKHETPPKSDSPVVCRPSRELACSTRVQDEREDNTAAVRQLPLLLRVEVFPWAAHTGEIHWQEVDRQLGHEMHSQAAQARAQAHVHRRAAPVRTNSRQTLLDVDVATPRAYQSTPDAVECRHCHAERLTYEPAAQSCD